MAYDNVSYIKPETSDAMCRLSTGGGFGTRRLYTDDEEVVFDAKRPQLLNAINPVVLRGDLQERSLQVHLTPIPPEERRQEREFWGEFEEAWSRIFGALLDAVGCALRNLDAVRLEGSPRMADFAAWVTAAEGGLGWEPGEFMEVYAGNRRQASEALLENDLVAAAVDNLLKTRTDGEYSGTAEDLLATLNHRATDEIKRSRSWPKAPNQLSRRLNLIAPALKEAGIDYRQHEEGRERRRIKTLRRIGPAPGKNDRRGATTSGGEAAGQDQGGAGGEDESSDDGSDLVFVDPNYLAELTELGWRRDARPPKGSTDGPLAVGAGPVEDPVARFLRHNVPVYRGPHSRLWHVPITVPLVLNAEYVTTLVAQGEAEGESPTPQEMALRLERAISALLERPYAFHDPALALPYFRRHWEEPEDPERLCSEGLLHAELWRHETTSEELWALLALAPGGSPPREEIEGSVWHRVTKETPPSDLFADGAEIPRGDLLVNDDGHFGS